MKTNHEDAAFECVVSDAPACAGACPEAPLNTTANKAAQRAYRLADEFYRRGVIDFLSVLDAQRAKLSAEDEQTKAETVVTVAMVSLYHAFGGSWDSNDQRGTTSMPQLRGNLKATVRNRGKPNWRVR